MGFFSSFAMLRQSLKDKFHVDSRTGIVTLIGQLDYERMTEYRFDVLVEDGGVPKWSDNAAVSLVVLVHLLAGLLSIFDLITIIIPGYNSCDRQQ